MNRQLNCLECGSSHIKLNGHTHYGKQNHQCKACGRQFVNDAQHLKQEKRELIKKMWLERISLRGICRVVTVRLRWLLDFIASVYEELPDDLNVRLPKSKPKQVRVLRLEAEADELWSFVQRKSNKQWVWIAMDTETKQVIAFHVGDRSRKSAMKLWKKIPTVYQANATFMTDDLDSCQKVIPKERHVVCAKGSGKTNIMERFNCTLRQRVSRLVRDCLSFSKSLCNHIGAIKYFICDYNLHVIARG
jgi:insertion element IS1 protein InsB